MNRIRLAALAMMFCSATLSAEDFEGVQPAAIDQPRVNVVLRRTANGAILSNKTPEGEVFNIEAFLDTGASSIVLSKNTAQHLGVNRESHGNNQTRFEDVGVGGGSEFAVSEPLFLSIAPGDPRTETEQKEIVDTVYTQTVGPIRTEVGPLESGGSFLESLVLGDLDIVGMPAMRSKVIVMDLKDANQFVDKIRTAIFNSKPGATDTAGVPKTHRHVKLSFASFKTFTKTIPPSDAGPEISPNPFIGPAPFHATATDKTPGVVVTQSGKSSTGSWLLDTGAVASMISRAQAAKIGVRYVDGSFGTDHPTLDGIPADRQFAMTVGGIGGSKKAAGIYLDSLKLQTREGTPIVFIKAPVLINDITVKDSTGKEFTLDGVFGMNFLVGSAKIDEGGMLPDIGKLTAGAFRYIVFDQPNGILGLE